MKKIMGKFNKHLFPVLTALVLVIGLFPSLSASAAWNEPVDYTELSYAVEYGADYNYVFYSWLGSNCVWTICKSSEPNKIVARALGSSAIDFNFEAGVSYIIRCYPFGTTGLSLTHIPNGTDIGFSASFDVEAGSSSTEFDSIPNADVYGWFKNWDDKASSREIFETFPLSSLSDPFSVVMPIDSELLFSKVAADTGLLYKTFIPMIAIDGFVASYASNKNVHITLHPTELVMKIPSSYWVQFQNEILDSKLETAIDDIEVIKEIVSVHKTNFAASMILVWDEFERVKESITASTTSVNNNIDLSKVEILNAISSLNDSIVAGTPEMDSIAQGSNQNLSNSSDKLDSLGDQLASVTKPNVEDIKPSSPEQIVTDPNAGVILSGPITSLWDNPVIFGIVSTVLTLVLLSWVFFGKK